MAAMSLLLAAAAAAPTAPLPQSVRNDLQCMAIYAAAAGIDDAQSKEVGGLGLVYYLGKVEVAAPGLDVGAALVEEMKQFEEGDASTAAGERCGQDFEATGKRLISLGEVLSAAGK